MHSPTESRFCIQNYVVIFWTLPISAKPGNDASMSRIVCFDFLPGSIAFLYPSSLHHDCFARAR